MSHLMVKLCFFFKLNFQDYIDCFNKLIKLNLKEKQAREIVHVVVDCCLQVCIK